MTLFKDHLNKDEKKKTKCNKGSKAKRSVKFNLEVQERTVIINKNGEPVCTTDKKTQLTEAPKIRK